MGNSKIIIAIVVGIIVLKLLAVNLYFPNPDIENTFLAQSLDTSSKSKKCLITNEVTRHFLSSLYVPMACTIIRVSISGLGNLKKTTKGFDTTKGSDKTKDKHDSSN